MTDRVFVVQRPAQYDPDKKGWVNKYDITPASAYGEFVFLLKPGNIFRDEMVSAIARMREALADYSVKDHVLAIGDPVAIAAAFITASWVSGGKVRVLKFDRRAKCYDSYLIDVT